MLVCTKVLDGSAYVAIGQSAAGDGERGSGSRAIKGDAPPDPLLRFISEHVRLILHYITLQYITHYSNYGIIK